MSLKKRIFFFNLTIQYYASVLAKNFLKINFNENKIMTESKLINWVCWGFCTQTNNDVSCK